MTWTDRDGYISLSWNMLKKFFGASLHAVLRGDDMSAVRVVHYIEVAHFIIRGTAAEKKKKNRKEINHSMCKKVSSVQSVVKGCICSPFTKSIQCEPVVPL